MSKYNITVIKEANALKSDPEQLILAIKKHPAIWNSRCPDYKIKKCKEVAWDKVASEVVDGWEDFTRSLKLMSLKFLVKRWNNIRDYYVKSLKARRRKKYAFAKQLSFLHPELKRKMHFQLSMNQQEDFKIETLDEALLEEDMEQNELEEERLEVLEDEEEIQEEIQEDYVTFVDSSEHSYDSSDQRTMKEQLVYEDSPEAEEDSDLMFLKSLLPDIKKLNDEEKFSFKYAIMQAYMDVLKKRKK